MLGPKKSLRSQQTLAAQREAQTCWTGRQRQMRVPAHAALGLLMTALLAQHAVAAERSAVTGTSWAADSTGGVQLAAANDNKLTTVEELRALLERQQQMISAQERQLQAQQSQIYQQQQDIADQRAVLQQVQARLADADSGDLPAARADEPELLAKVQSLEERLASIPEDPRQALDDPEFPGSFRVPGTNARMKFGGFVNTVLVEGLDPLAINDRFVVGSIPVDRALVGAEKEASLTANRSRMNLELRDKTALGDLRGFIEGDFAGSGDTFRLRHAYGQYRNFLTGKTWSTFYDPQAWPEEVDFEGLNGGTILRQTQVRWFPELGKNWDLQFAIEDPTSQASEIDLTGSPDENDPDFNPDFGQQKKSASVTDWPDFVASIRRTWFGRWHLKTAFVLHPVKAQYGQRADLPTENEWGWGFSESGVVSAPWLDERDNIRFQVLYGEGVSRYVNDANSIGGQDAVFTPDGSELKTLPILAGFLAYQHWWSDKLRSNFIFSAVDIDNESFQSDSAYKRTVRVSTNVFWSPTPRMDLAAEYLWGKRENKNGDDDDATQIQFATKYRF